MFVVNVDIVLGKADDDAYLKIRDASDLGDDIVLGRELGPSCGATCYS